MADYTDRTTAIGKMIDAYLRSEADLDDHAIHLLFAANRWELASVHPVSLSPALPNLTDALVFGFFPCHAAFVMLRTHALW